MWWQLLSIAFYGKMVFLLPSSPLHVHAQCVCNGLPVRRFSAVSVLDFISCEIGPPEFLHESLLRLINGPNQ